LKLLKLFKKSKYKNSKLIELEKKLSYKFTDKTLLETAFVHRSLIKDANKNYERLEFLGDAVIDNVVSDWLYHKYPFADEGWLTIRRSALVKKTFLSQLAKHLNFLEFLEIGRGLNLNDPKVRFNLRGNIFEAVVGAIYVDGGIKSANTFIYKTIIENEHLADFHSNYKGKLIELCHTLKLANPMFALINEDGPEHDKFFNIQVTIGNNYSFIGKAKSKKDAEQTSAKIAFEHLKKL
jgi:ribonuclease III